MLIDTNLGPIVYSDEEIYITDVYINIGNDGTNDYLNEILSLIDVELGNRIDGDTGSVSNAVLIADGTNGKTLKAATNVVINNNGCVSIGSTEASATVDITQTCSCTTGFELNGASDCTCTLFQINEGNGINSGNIFEINRYGGSGGDKLVISGEYLGINKVDPEKYLDVNGDSRIIGSFTVGFSSWTQLGNGLDIYQIYNCVMTKLSSTRIVIIDIYNDKLRVYDWDGSDWTKVGNDYHINSNGYDAIAALNSTDIAFIDDNNDELRLYRFDGSDWSQIGSGLSLTGVGVPALTALNGTDVAFFDSGNDELRTYRWGGSSWSQIGNSYTLGQTHSGSITALTDETVVLADNYEDSLKTFRWDGTNWSPVGNKLNIGSNYPSLTALNNTDIAVVDSNTKEIRVYRWNGSDWNQTGPSLEITGMGYPTIVALNSADIAYADSALDELRTYRFSDVIALSTNHHKVGIGIDDPERILDLRGSCGEDLVNVANESGTTILRVDYDGLIGVWEEDPETVFELTHTEPYITLHNSTEQDSDGGRESKIIFKGEQTGGEESALAIIEASHSGALDNERGKLSFYINDGNDGDSPTLSMFIDYTGYINLADTRNKITTGGLEIIMEQTGDESGASRLHVRNRTGNSGILIENATADFSDCNLIGNSGYESGLRYEHRSGNIIGGSDNTVGEFQFIDDITDSTNATVFFSTNKEATVISTGNFGIGESDPETSEEITADSPAITLHNDTNEDDDDGRDSEIIFKGHNSNDEESTLAVIRVSHDGTADDQKGRLGIYINDGTSDNEPPLVVEVDGDGNTKIGDGGIEDYSNFSRNGRLTLNGDAKVWKCIDLEPYNIGLPSSNPPDVDDYQGFALHRYDRSTEEQVFFVWHVPNDFSTGSSSVRGHFGLFVENPPSGTGDENVVLGFEYKRIVPGANIFDFSSGTSSGTVNVNIEDGESPYTWHSSETGYCDTTGWDKDGIVLFRFYRDATNPSDTYDNEAVSTDNDVWIGMYHLEYLIDSLGGD